MTFADLAAERPEKGDPLRPGTRRDYLHVLGKDVLPTIGNVPAKAVKRDDVIGDLDAISSRGATRRTVLSVLWVRHHFDIWFPVLDYGRLVVQKAMVANNRGPIVIRYDDRFIRKCRHRRK
jgi:hypothetical protein